MRVLIISDLHYDRKIYKGVDESKAWSWLLSIVDYHKPDLLLSCGDWGSAISFGEFYELLKKTIVLSIYGNHENMEVLTKLYNIKSDKYLPVLMEDGRIYEFCSLKIAGISGIISTKRKSRKGVPRKRPDEFIEVAKRLVGKNIDILLIHEVPYLPNLFKNIRDSVPSRTALKAVELIKSKIVINGHMHDGFKVYKFNFGTLYLNVDSSQLSRHYLVMDENKVSIYKDVDQITEFKWKGEGEGVYHLGRGMERKKNLLLS